MRMRTSALLTFMLALAVFAPAAFAQPGPPAQPSPQAQPRPVPPPPQAQPGAPASEAPGPQNAQQRGDGPRPAFVSIPTPFPEPNVVLEELVRDVAEASDREFLIHASVPARIYVGTTIEETPTYPQLVSILAANELAVFESEGIVNITRDGMARTLPTRIVQVDDESIPDDEIVTRVVTVPAGSRVSAAQLVPLLRPMQGQNAHLTAFSGDRESESKLVIVDRYANVRRITEVVRQIAGAVGL